jgi:tight adherence protein B
MALIVILTFIGVFAVVAVPLVFADGNSAKSRQAVAVLESVIKAELPSAAAASNQVLDFRKKEEFSSIPWLNSRLLNLKVAPELRRMLEQAEVDWSLGRLMGTMGLCFAVPAALIYMRYGLLWVAVLVSLAPGALPLLWILWKRNKRLYKFQEKLPAALDLMVSAMRAGHSLLAAMGLVAKECPDPIGGEFKICFEEQNYGLELKTALDNLVTRIPLQDLRMVGVAILIQKESGGNLAEVLDKTSYLIRERFRIKREIKTHTAQGRLTGWILTSLPVFLGLAMFFLNPDYISLLWHRDIGIKLMWGAAGMICLGGYIIRRIVDIEV